MKVNEFGSTPERTPRDYVTYLQPVLNYDTQERKIRKNSSERKNMGRPGSAAVTLYKSSKQLGSVSQKNVNRYFNAPSSRTEQGQSKKSMRKSSYNPTRSGKSQ